MIKSSEAAGSIQRNRVNRSSLAITAAVILGVVALSAGLSGGRPRSVLDASSASVPEVTETTGGPTVTTATTLFTSSTTEDASPTLTAMPRTRGALAPTAAPVQESGPPCHWTFSQPRESSGRTEGTPQNWVNVSVSRPDLEGHVIDFHVSYSDSPNPQTVRAQSVTGDAAAGTFSAKVGVYKQDGGQLVVTAHVVDGGAADCTSHTQTVNWPPGTQVSTPSSTPGESQPTTSTTEL